MSKRSVAHATFSIERVYDASPVRVFQAFADKDAKHRWFGCGDGWDVQEYTLDFRVGGRETFRGSFQGGPVHRNDTIYRDIIPDERIIYAYDMFMDDVRISVSLTTIEFRPEGKGTRLVLTEQDAFLDGYDNAGSREEGTRELLEALGAELRRERVGAK